MIELPKIAVKRLATESPLDAHPDANILNSFVERELSSAERDTVLEHLALCGSCRDIIALAVPETLAAVTLAQEEVEHGVPVPIGVGTQKKLDYDVGQARTKFSLSRFLVPNLRWAALAAGVVLAVALAIVRSGNLNVAELSHNGSGPQIVAVPATPLPPNNPASDAAKTNSSSSGNVAAIPPQNIAPTNTNSEVMPQTAGRGPDRTKQDRAKEDSLVKEPSSRSSATRNSQPTELAEVVPPASPVASSPQGSSDSPGDAKPIVRAKPASQSGTESASTTSVEIWTVTNGVLQRSSDGGQTWKDALPASHQILCYANQERQVWAGGKQGVLFYSSDNGSTWSPVQPTFQGNRLTSDVLNIEVHEAGEIILSTSNNSTWLSTDRGETWQKK